MNLHDLYSKEGAKGLKQLALRSGVSPKYLYHCATNRKKPGYDLAYRLADADSRLTVQELRPDIFARAIGATIHEPTIK